MKAIYAEHKSSGKLAMLGISLDHDRQVLQARLDSEQMRWPQYFDGRGWENRISRLYRITSIPNTVLIDPEGRILYKKLAAVELRRILQEKLK